MLAAGERGEIELRGDNVMLGYYKAPDATARSAARDGWLATGDLGYRDADGFYFITGRLKELIIKGGENIAPREIDEALLRASGRARSARQSASPTRRTDRRSSPASSLKPACTCTEDDAARALPARRSAATRRRVTCASSPSCPKDRQARCSG